ncbi:MAG: tandem-95 repeat protein, partial [Ilumatobacteraceae bacterium]
SSSASSTAYTVSGSGKDIWENNFDGFQFIYRPMTGDGSLTARIASEDVTYNGVHNPTLLCWAADNSHQQPCISVSKSEVMFRQDLTNVSAMHASVGMTQGNGSEYIYRTTVGASTGAASPGDSLNFPYWVRLTRRGDQLTAEISPDGVNWTQRGTTQTIALGSTVYVGLASSAVYQLDTSTNQSTKRNTTQFDNVSISTPPTAVADAYFVNEDTTLTVPAVSGVLFNDSDAEGSILTTDLVTGTTGLTLNPDGSFTYVPPANFSGTASFTYAADDGVLNSPPATVTITVNSSNETPSFSKGADQIIGSNLGPQITAGWATAISQGTGETDQLVDFIVTNTNNSLFSVQPAVSTDGTLSYTSAADATGTATVSVSIHDNGGTSNGAADTSAVQTFTITIDDPPVVTATATSLAYIENATTALDPGVTVTDSDNATVASATVTMTANYVNGQDTLAFVNQNGITGTWTPATGVLALSGTSSVANYQAALRSITYFNNSDSPATATRTVTFQANDGLLPSNLASRTITITAVNDPPVAAADSYSVNEDTTLTVPVNTGVLANDTDVDGNPLTAVLVSGTSVTLNSNGSFTYVPPANFNGTASFSYKANDGSSDSNVVTVTLTVVAVNDVPSFAKGASQSVPMNGSGATVAGWATSISQGTGDTGQVVNFIVTNNNNPIFSVQPAVSATGTLTYTPAVNAAGVATVSVSIHDNGGTANGGVDTSAVQTFTITITDTVGPTGGSVDAGSLVGTGTRYSTSTTLSLVLNKGADPSGLATTGAVLDRATATLTSGGTADGVCGSYGSFALVTGGTDPVSPKSDSVPASGCYKYQYIVKDTVGNSTTYTSPDIKVDTSVPTTPSLVFSAFTKAYWSGSGTTVFYNSSTGISGSFTATATATDTTSGILSYAWPALGTGWTSTPGALGVNTYSWTPVPTAPATKTVTATNNASSTSLTSPFTLTGDAVIPTGGAVSYLNGSQTSTTILVTFGSSTDAASGIATRLLQRASATLTGTTCGTYSSFSTVVNGTNPAGTTLTDTVAHGNCYKYQYVVTDNVGNVDSNTSVNVTKNS